MARTTDQSGMEAISVAEFAARLHVSSRTVERWIAEEGLRAVKIGRTIRIFVADAEAFLQRHQASDNGDTT